MENTAIFLAEGFEEIEALTVVDLLRRAGLPIQTVSVTGDLEVMGSHKIPVRADLLFDEVDFDALDMIILPGGYPGYENLASFTPLVDRIKEFIEKDKKVSAICGAPSVLGRNGLLNGKEACCFPGMEEMLLGAKTNENSVTVDGNITTSRGMGTSIDFGLAIVERYQGKEAAQALAKKIVYIR